LNLALAHYREVSGALYDDAGAQVITRLRDLPIGLTDIKSWLFFAIGMVWATFALVDGVLFTDPYPGYAPLEQRVRKAHDEYIACKDTLIDQLRDIRDDAARQMEETQSDLDKRRYMHASILAGRARMIQLFEQHQDQLERAGNALLSRYRTANRQARQTQAPGRFDEPWRMERIHVQSDLPETLVRADLDREIRESQDLLRREILAIHKAFEDAVETYRQIDDLVPEERLWPAGQEGLATDRVKQAS
jgi:hypothetical protein